MSDKIYKTGVYIIKNLVNNKCYVGSTAKQHFQKSMSGFYRRFEHHKQALRKNTHSNRHLQRAWNKYQECNFKFEILAYCPPEYCIKLEQWFIDNLKPVYNIRIRAENNLGIKQTKEHIQKRTNSFKQSYYAGKHQSEGHPKRKLNENQVREIRKLLQDGLSTRKCGKLFNVYGTTIQAIKQGKNWSHIS